MDQPLPDVEERPAPAEAPVAGVPEDVPAISRRRRRLVEPLVLVAAHVAVTTYATWPLVRHLPSRAPGDLGDPLQSAWIFGWSIHQFFQAPLRVFDAPMFHPTGLSLAFTENMLGLSLPLAPLYWATDNALLLQNAILLTTILLASIGGHLLVRHLGASHAVSFACGLAYAFMPYRISKIGHPHVWGTHLLPFVLLFLLKASEEGIDARRRRVRLAGLAFFVAWQSWASLTGAVMCGLLVGTWAIWMLLRGRAVFPRLWRGLVAAALGFLLALPVVLPYVKARQDNPRFGHLRDAVLMFSATPSAYLDPGTPSKPLEDAYRPMIERFRTEQGYWEKALFPGAALALGLLVAVPLIVATRRRGVAVPLLGAGVALIGFTWSLGPQWGASPDGFPLPFALVERVTGGLTRVPARMGVLVPLGLAVVAGVGLSRLGRKAGGVVVVAMLALLALERYPPVSGFVAPPTITEAHRAVADRPGAVLAMPVYEYDQAGAYIQGPLYDSQHLYLSTAHYRPMLNGYGSYHPDSYWGAVHAVQDLPSQDSLFFLATRGVETVVVQTQQLPGTKWAGLVEAMDAWPGVRRVASSDGVVVYDVSAAARAAAAAEAAEVAEKAAA